MDTQLSNKEVQDQYSESKQRRLDDMKKILEANGYRVVKVSR